MPETPEALTPDVHPEAYKGSRDVFFHGERRAWSVLDRGRLRPGNRIEGPLIVEERQHNTVVLPGQTLTVDAFANLIIDSPVEEK
jgi:N-methylhydantoinase A/oxoprolinase/acetone carboxylase beta subunit